MDLSKEQIKCFCSYISIYDIKQYIKEHQLEYEEFLKQKKS